MNFDEWMKSVPQAMKDDALWKMKVYRLALFLADIAWHDVTKLMDDRRTLGLSDQLYRSVGSISANIGEGYSRSSGKDQARFYEYALGSAREARDWYFKGRHILGSAVFDHRLQLLTEIIRLLLSIIPEQRTTTLREEQAPYGHALSEPTTALEHLLANVPLPNP
ncbi:MAG: four helix bundle protein [Verrucomicrobia bacterium]|nr:four helix bundle protein [Verrucomicrobiota bacterium]